MHKYLISQKQKQKEMVRKSEKDVVTIDQVFGWSVMVTGSTHLVNPSGRNVIIIQSIHRHSKWEEEQQHEGEFREKNYPTLSHGNRMEN